MFLSSGLILGLYLLELATLISHDFLRLKRPLMDLVIGIIVVLANQGVIETLTTNLNGKSSFVNAYAAAALLLISNVPDIANTTHTM